MRRSVRRAATGVGALALILGASACGATDELAGGDEGVDEPAVEEPAEGEGGEDSENADADGADTESGDAAEESGDGAGTAGEEAAGDEEGDAAEEPLDQADLDAATARFMEFVTTLDDGDREASCSFFIDPTTGEPVEGETLKECADAFGDGVQGLESNALDAVDESLLDVSDNGDGTVSISMEGSEFPFPMVEADDGEWYLLIG